MLSLFRKKQSPWWIEINTAIPNCTYYFGPFDSVQEAKPLQAGYLEDLVNEQAQGITVVIKQCQPAKLTIFDED